jgi:hypothetical protein
VAKSTSQRLKDAVTGSSISVTVPWSVSSPVYGVPGSGTATYTIATNGARQQYEELCDLLDRMQADGRASVA